MAARNFIDGVWVAPRSGTPRGIVNPSTGEVFDELLDSTREDVDLAVAAARKALRKGWADTKPAYRADLLKRIAKGIRENSEQLSTLESRNVGKPLSEARLDIAESAECFEYYAKLAETLDGSLRQDIHVARLGFRSSVCKDAIGVVALIVPWNFPFLLASWKVAPALAAGCAIVLKPSELTPLSAIELAKLCERADLPAGVFNLLLGNGIDSGRPLAMHPDVDKISFTGSSETGGGILRDISRSIRPVTLELGGKSPMLVFDSADLKDSVQWALIGAYANSGQICSATSRLIVQNSIYETFVEMLVAAVRQIRIGAAEDEMTQMGPLISEAHLKKVMKAVATGAVHGRLLTGNPLNRLSGRGCFMDPIVFGDVNFQSELWQEEIFGPVLCVNSFDSETEAIQLANDSRYGLAAAVMSRDVELCDRVAKQLHAGIVWENCSQPALIEAPWSGWKQSGIGTELGTWGLESYLRIKQVTKVI